MGQSDIQDMKCEIHRMEVRASQLDHQKEALIQEMEMSVSRREHIQVKAKVAKSKGTTTQAQIQKEVCMCCCWLP